jgi:hypothetical protein
MSNCDRAHRSRIFPGHIRTGEREQDVKHPTTRQTLAIVATAMAVAVPAQAAAKGGAGGGGGPAPAPTPTPTGAPCLTLTPTNGGSEFKRNATVGARFAVANCSSSPVTITPSFTSISTAWSPIPIVPTPVPCAGPSGTAAPLTLKAGEQRSVEFSVPPNNCPVGPQGTILEVDATARDAASTVAKATAFYQITLRP